MVQVAMVPFARQVLATAKGLGARREAQKRSTPKPVVQGFEPDFGFGYVGVSQCFRSPEMVLQAVHHSEKPKKAVRSTSSMLPLTGKPG